MCALKITHIFFIEYNIIGYINKVWKCSIQKNSIKHFQTTLYIYNNCILYNIYT